MPKYTDVDVFDIALRSGWIPPAANSTAFEAMLGRSPAEPDRFYNTTTKQIEEYVAGVGWRDMQAGLLSGYTATDLIVKKAWGHVNWSGGDINFVTRAISGAGGTYYGDGGFTSTPAFCVANRGGDEDPTSVTAWDKVTYTGLTANGVTVTMESRFGSVFGAYWMAIGT